MIKHIQIRTKKGLAPNGKEWSGKAGRYTESYAKAKSKKVPGTSKDGPVDLALSHKMIEAMRYFSSKSGSDKITIGYQKGSKQAGKAEGNILGTYGKKTPIRGKARPFLNISKKDFDKIKRKYTKDDSQD